MTKQEFIDHIAKIGWSVKGPNDINMFVHNEKGERTKIRVKVDCVEVPGSGEMDIAFYFKGLKPYELGDGALGVKAKGTEGVFLQFYNRGMG